MVLISRFRKYAKVLALAVLFLFVFNVYYINIKKDAHANLVNEITAEFQEICPKLPDQSRVYIDGDPTGMDTVPWAIHFYLSGNYLSSLPNADFILSQNSAYNDRRITDNKRVNLFHNIPSE